MLKNKNKLALCFILLLFNYFFYDYFQVFGDYSTSAKLIRSLGAAHLRLRLALSVNGYAYLVLWCGKTIQQHQ